MPKAVEGYRKGWQQDLPQKSLLAQALRTALALGWRQNLEASAAPWGCFRTELDGFLPNRFFQNSHCQGQVHLPCSAMASVPQVQKARQRLGLDLRFPGRVIGLLARTVCLVAMCRRPASAAKPRSFGATQGKTRGRRGWNPALRMPRFLRSRSLWPRGGPGRWMPSRGGARANASPGFGVAVTLGDCFRLRLPAEKGEQRFPQGGAALESLDRWNSEAAVRCEAHLPGLQDHR